jgi:hypothetical protein
MQANRPVPGPQPQPGSFIPLLAAGGLEHQAVPSRASDRRTHQHCPPGWNGSPSRTGHRLPRLVTIAGSLLIQFRTR